MDSDEDEVFFGPVTEKEEYIASKYRNRRTLVLPHRGPLLRRWSIDAVSVPKPPGSTDSGSSIVSSAPNTELNTTCNPLLATYKQESQSESDSFASSMSESPRSNTDLGPPSGPTDLVTYINEHSDHSDYHGDHSSSITTNDEVSYSGDDIKETQYTSIGNMLSSEADSYAEINSDVLEVEGMHNASVSIKECEYDKQNDEEYSDSACEVYSATETVDSLSSESPKAVSPESDAIYMNSDVKKSTTAEEIEECVNGAILSENPSTKLHEIEIENMYVSNNINQDISAEETDEKFDTITENPPPRILVTPSTPRATPGISLQVLVPPCYDDGNETFSSTEISMPVSLSSYCENDSLETMNTDTYGSRNRAMVVSDFADSQTSSADSLAPFPSCSQGEEEDEEDNELQLEDISAGVLDASYVSHDYSHSSHDDSCISHKDSHNSHDGSEDALEKERSPSPRFNDTLEEIEMLLKYGANYGEKIEEGKANLPEDIVMEKSDEQEIVSETDDPIVSPRKSSVTSTVSTFHPAFESTRASSTCVKEVIEHVEVKSDPPYSPAKSQNEVKRDPPPKPPRNLYGTSTNGKIYPPIKDSTPGPIKNRPTVSARPTPEENENQVRSTSRRALPPVYKSGASKQVMGEGTKLFTPKQSPINSASGGKPGSRPALGGSGPVRLGMLAPRNKLAPSPNSTPTSSRTITKSQTPGPRLYSLKPNIKSGLLPHSVSRNRQPITVTAKLPGSQATRNKPSTPDLYKFQRPQCKPGMSNIVSPIARYLKHNPPPPLVRNIKPRYKVSPVKQTSEPLLVEPAESSFENLLDMETSGVRREATLNNIQNNLDELSSKMNIVQVSKMKEGAMRKGQVLPYVVSSSALSVVVGEENKENKMLRHRGEFLVEREPVLVLKHKGHIMVPKGSVCDFKIPARSPSKITDNKSPTKKASGRSSMKMTLPPNITVPSLPRSSERESLVEISICEPCKTE